MYRGGVVAARRAHNAEVGGSKPLPDTNFLNLLLLLGIPTIESRECQALVVVTALGPILSPEKGNHDVKRFHSLASWRMRVDDHSSLSISVAKRTFLALGDGDAAGRE